VQTREVFRTIADEGREQPDRERWHALQSWLETAESRVTIPYASILAEGIGDVAVWLRRDFTVILSLIWAHAILHQASRGRNAKGHIVATLEDYARVRGLVAELVAEGVEATVPPPVRETVEAVGKLVKDSDAEQVTNKALAEELSIEKAAVSKRVRAATNLGYLKNLEDRRGHAARLVLGEPMPEDVEILPTVAEIGEELSGCAVEHTSGQLQHPPPRFDGDWEEV
jgi:hypothetical protein